MCWYGWKIVDVVSEKLWKIGAEVWSAGDGCPKRVILILSNLSNILRLLLIDVLIFISLQIRTKANDSVGRDTHNAGSDEKQQ